jgi:hypothetical protein
MGYGAGMPELRNDPTTGFVNGIRDNAPTRNLLHIP